MLLSEVGSSPTFIGTSFNDHINQNMLIKILDQIEQHNCGKHLVFSEEHPLHLRFRSKCECCGKSWFLTFPMIKLAMGNPKLDLDGRKILLKRIRDITDNKKYKKVEYAKCLNPNALGNISVDELFKKILIGEYNGKS